MAQYKITLINQTDGSVTGHKAGCADIKRGKKNADEPWTFTVAHKQEAWLNYNSDFLGECDLHDDECDEEHAVCRNAYDIKWLPCADGVPEYAEEKQSAKRLSPEELDKPVVGIDKLVVGPKGGVIIQVEVEGRMINLRKVDAVRLARQLNAITGTTTPTELNR